MKLSEFEMERIKRLFSKHIEQRIPSHLRPLIKVVYRTDGCDVKIFESRKQNKDCSRWLSVSIAKLSKALPGNCWTLYYADRDGKWVLYDHHSIDSDMEKLFIEIKKDPLGLFWG